MHWFFFLFFLILTLAVIWKEKSAFDKNTVDNNGPDVGACSAFYGCHWFLFEMAGAVIFIISCRGGKKILHHHFYVSSVRLGHEICRRFAVCSIFRRYGRA